MGEGLGFSVRIFIPSGEPEGLRVIEKSNWTGQGLIFPRSIYPQVRTRDEIKRTGIYLLWGPSESGQLPKVYVGEGDALVDRLDSHARNKDFWTQGIAFISKDQNLNKAHIQYLESRLVSLAKEAKRCNLENSNAPQTPSLSEADTADAELYLADMLLCLPILGIDFFERPRSQEEVSQDRFQQLFLEAKGIRASGNEDVSGFVVRAGSQAVKDEAQRLHPYLSNLRKTLVLQGILVEDGNVNRLSQDYIFSSPSNAACVLLGNHSNGRLQWKDINGRTLREIQEASS